MRHFCTELVSDRCRRTRKMLDKKMIDKRRMSRRTGGHVDIWPGVKWWGHLPKGVRVSEHLQTGPGGCYVLQRQTPLQSFSRTKILWCKRTSPKAWLLFHLNSVARIPLQPTPWLCATSCLKQLLHPPDTKHSAPCGPSFPLFVFTTVLSLWEVREDQTRSVSASLRSGLPVSFQSESETVPRAVCPCVHLCMLTLPGILWSSSSTTAQSIRWIERMYLVNQLISSYFVIHPTGWAPAAEEWALNRPNAEL